MGKEGSASREAQVHEERIARHAAGMPVLLGNILLTVGSFVLFVLALVWSSGGSGRAWPVVLAIAAGLYGFIVGPILFAGLKVIKPQEAMVLTLFGRYLGTLKGEGFYFVNPFVSSVVPEAVRQQASAAEKAASMLAAKSGGNAAAAAAAAATTKRKISLKAMTLNNERQKINDALGNPIIIGIVVIWKVVNTYRAVFDVDNFTEYLSIQCDSALRNIVRLYPYDSTDEESEKSLRGSSREVAARLKEEIQEKADIAGIEIIEARITHLSYAPEIAAAMLQRQQASAIIAARQMIVEGAVGMVEMALAKLSENQVVQLDEERKAAMVSNLLVVLCGNRDAQPVVNSGSLY
jgi:regulator of protease activity HflC (stomatin/prohibitin superfamily)